MNFKSSLCKIYMQKKSKVDIMMNYCLAVLKRLVNKQTI